MCLRVRSGSSSYVLFAILIIFVVVVLQKNLLFIYLHKKIQEILPCLLFYVTSPTSSFKAIIYFYRQYKGTWKKVI